MNSVSKKNNFFRLEMLFLKILDEKNCYGYEITHSLKELTHGIIIVNIHIFRCTKSFNNIFI